MKSTRTIKVDYLANTREVPFRLCLNTGPQRACLTRQPRRRQDSPFVQQSEDSADVRDHAASEMAIGSKLGIDATKKLPGEGFKRPWPPLIRMNEEVRRKVDALFGGTR